MNTPLIAPSGATASTLGEGPQRLAVYDWPHAPARPNTPLRGQVLVLHGLGEHAGRHAALAQRLQSWGFAVRAYDQYGHGQSAGARGDIRSSEHLLDDLSTVVDHTRQRMAPGQPLLLLGHSMGGLVAARWVSLKQRPVQALILSSPALDAGLKPWQRLLLQVLPRWVPHLRIASGLDLNGISHDPAVIAAYRSDPLVHNRISALLAEFIAQAGPATLAHAPHWRVPTLLLYAGQDRLVAPAGSHHFRQTAPPAVVRSHCFEDLYHEIFLERHAEPVFSALQKWLAQRF